ncbi:MAG: tripartite tricarboxylate transporter substrate binding protein [Rhizobiales bacterium]|jgi:tripartite-type tricarboxylate transporter receptor subunit TctC|nr:tripartite tricarboxylate transporter substrate binding protein [Hyphomicrobiales bacterium]
MRKTILRCIFATLLSAGAAVPAAAQWPTRPITLTVAFAAGGVTDGVARKIAIELGKKLSGDVVVENKGGAGGGLAAMAVIRSAADGYSLLFASSGPAALNKLIYKKLAYDPQKDLTPIVLVGFIPQVIAAKPTLPVNNLKEFVEYAKKHQGKMTFGNSGIGTTSQIAAAWFSHDTGIQATHVAYRGTAPLVNDVMGGQIDAGFPGFFPQTTSLKLLAVTSDKRIEALPDVPTVKETGVADLTSGLWFGLMGPANLPRPIVDRINKIVNDYLATDEAKTIARTLGMRILGGTPEDMRDLAANEIKRLRPIVEEAKISVD